LNQGKGAHHSCYKEITSCNTSSGVWRFMFFVEACHSTLQQTCKLHCE